jgi:hypothetical protein
MTDTPPPDKKFQSDREDVRWRNMSKAFWAACVLFFGGGATLVVLSLMDATIADRVVKLEGFLWTFFGPLVTIILGYFGFSSYVQRGK